MTSLRHAPHPPCRCRRTRDGSGRGWFARCSMNARWDRPGLHHGSASPGIFGRRRCRTGMTRDGWHRVALQMGSARPSDISEPSWKDDDISERGASASRHGAIGSRRHSVGVDLDARHPEDRNLRGGHWGSLRAPVQPPVVGTFDMHGDVETSATFSGDDVVVVCCGSSQGRETS
jgi:hypothetical protein